jgi:hypothetical protein
MRWNGASFFNMTGMAMDDLRPAGGRYLSRNGRECFCMVGKRIVFVEYDDGGFSALNFDQFRRWGFTPVAHESHVASAD